ncbi:MAG TPA: hypothetical protein VLX28_20235 [Thermoanaerobaculia bacterium]|nr:hypothetical protein [Thermoanaerobaculia bacterium]
MAGARKEDRHSSHRLILDSGAVIALARGDQRALAFLAHILTGDLDDLERLAAQHPEVRIHPL